MQLLVEETLVLEFQIGAIGDVSRISAQSKSISASGLCLDDALQHCGERYISSARVGALESSVLAIATKKHVCNCC